MNNITVTVQGRTFTVNAANLLAWLIQNSVELGQLNPVVERPMNNNSNEILLMEDLKRLPYGK